MGTCHNCHNIVPRTVDRCPVCGVVPEVEGQDIAEELDIAPGWSSDAAAPRTSREGAGSLHPDDFLSELMGGEPAERSVEPEPADTGGLPAPPAPPTRPGRRQPETPAPPSPPIVGEADASDVAPPALPPPALPPPAHSAAEPRKDPASIQAATRAVLAGSSRIEGDIKIGASSGHGLKIAAAAAFAVLCLVVGFAAGWVGTAQQTLAFTEDGTEIGDGEVAIGDPGSTVPSLPEVSPDLAEEYADSSVQLWLDDCLLFSTTDGIVTGPNTVLAPASAVQTDSTPYVATDDRRGPGRVVGVSLVNNMAVIRTDDPIGEPFTWGTAGRVAEGSTVTILDHGGRDLEAIAANVTSVSRSKGIVDEFAFADVRVGPGSAVLDSDGFLIGVVDNSGRSALTADLLRPAATRLITRPNNPDSKCPAPPPAPSE